MNRLKSEVQHFSELEHVWWGLHSPAGQKRYDNKYKVFKRMCSPKESFKILEVGAGDGEFTKRISKLKTKIIATDITPKLVSEGRKKFKKNNNIIFKVQDFEKLSFKNNVFDIVYGISILHHVNYEKALKGTYRVLKDDGQIFFTEPNLLNPAIFLGLNIPFLRKRMEYSNDETALVRWRMEKVLHKIGFREVVVVNYDFLHPSTPNFLIRPVETAGGLLEKIPFVKEFSGSIIIWAKK